MRVHVSKPVNEKTADGIVVVMTYIEASGSSDEEKPTRNILDGSIFVESDSGDVYFYNEKESSWIRQFSFQG